MKAVVKLMTSKLTLKVLVPLALIVMMVSTVYAAPPTQLWSDPVGTNDITLSKDGKYVAVATLDDKLQFYSRSSGTPLWVHAGGQDSFKSVAISAEGDCVVAGSVSGYVYLWKNARALTGDPPATWQSVVLGGPINRRCIDISDDGNYVAACGTGTNVFYWASAKEKSGSSVATTWFSGLAFAAEAIDLSSDGDYVAVGFGTDVAYWKSTRTLTGTQAPAWTSTEPDSPVVDVALSDDGNYVVTASERDLSVHYWANAKSLTGNPASAWWGGADVSFSSVDISSNGDSVIAGASFPSGVYFWSGARGLSGKPQSPSWIYTTEIGIHDVAINDAGDYMAAAQSAATPHRAYLFSRAGDLKWSFDLENPSLVVSISGDGGTLAIGTSSIDTAYLLSTGFSTPQSRPVGGVVTPTNKLEILTPYLTLAGLVVALSTVVTFKKRRA
jgi:WD40 repeat protein